MQPLQLRDQGGPQLGRVLRGEVRQPAVLGVAPTPPRRGSPRGCSSGTARSRSPGARPGTPARPSSGRGRCPGPRGSSSARGAAAAARGGTRRCPRRGRWRRRAGAGSTGPSRRRDGLTVMALMAEIRSCRSQLLQDRRLAPRGERAAHGRGEHEARLVEEHQVGPPPPGPADDPGQLLTPSVGDGRLVALPGPPLRLLAGPAQPPLEDLADVLGVEGARRSAARSARRPGRRSTARSASRGPWPPAAAGPPARLQLAVGEAGRAAGVGLGGELAGVLAGELHPGVDGGPAAAEEVGDVLGRFALR